MPTEYRYAHRILRGGQSVNVRSNSTYEEMGEAYGEEYLGEVCSASGMLKRPYVSPRVEELIREAAFEFSQGPQGKTAFDLWCGLKGNNTDKTYSTFIKELSPPEGKPMHDPLHESVFGESNLATPQLGNPTWQELYAQDCQDFGVESANERLAQRSVENAYRLPERQRSELEKLLEATEIKHPDQVGIITPTREDYSAACKGERPWPVVPQFLGQIQQLLSGSNEPLPEIKGVVLRGSKLPAHLQAIIDDVMSQPAMSPDNIFTFLEEVNRQEAMRFLVTSRSEEVIKALRKWIKRMRNRAETESLNRRSAEKQLALFKINVEHLERQTFVVLADIFDTQGFRREYIIDNVEDTTFNVSIKTKNGGVPIMTIRYDDYGFVVKAHR